jgi:hypothetical protein
MTMPMTARATSTTAITSSIAAVPRYSGSWSDIPLHVTLCSNNLVEGSVLGKVVSAPKGAASRCVVVLPVAGFFDLFEPPAQERRHRRGLGRPPTSFLPN